MINLADLPADHPLRNAPLGQIRAEYRNLKNARWSEIKPSFGVAKSTFNSLAPFWRELNEWRCRE